MLHSGPLRKQLTSFAQANVNSLKLLRGPHLQRKNLISTQVLIRHHCRPARTASGPTSAERPPALRVVRSSHGAASWSPFWAAAEGLGESWLSTLPVGRAGAVTSPAAPVGVAGLFPEELMPRSRMRFHSWSPALLKRQDEAPAKLIVLILKAASRREAETSTNTKNIYRWTD